MEPVSEETAATTQDGDEKSPNSNPETAILSGRGQTQQLDFLLLFSKGQNETEEVTVGHVKEQLKNLSFFVKENQDDRTW